MVLLSLKTANSQYFELIKVFACKQRPSHVLEITGIIFSMAMFTHLLFIYSLTNMKVAHTRNDTYLKKKNKKLIGVTQFAQQITNTRLQSSIVS